MWKVFWTSKKESWIHPCCYHQVTVLTIVCTLIVRKQLLLEWFSDLFTAPTTSLTSMLSCFFSPSEKMVYFQKKKFALLHSSFFFSWTAYHNVSIHFMQFHCILHVHVHAQLFSVNNSHAVLWRLTAGGIMCFFYLFEIFTEWLSRKFCGEMSCEKMVLTCRCSDSSVKWFFIQTFCNHHIHSKP